LWWAASFPSGAFHSHPPPPFLFPPPKRSAPPSFHNIGQLQIESMSSPAPPFRLGPPPPTFFPPVFFKPVLRPSTFPREPSAFFFDLPLPFPPLSFYNPFFLDQTDSGPPLFLITLLPRGPSPIRQSFFPFSFYFVGGLWELLLFFLGPGDFTPLICFPR